MICREQLENPNLGLDDDRSKNWCDCRQGECVLDPMTEERQRVAAGEYGGLDRDPEAWSRQDES